MSYSPAQAEAILDAVQTQPGVREPIDPRELALVMDMPQPVNWQSKEAYEAEHGFPRLSVAAWKALVAYSCALGNGDI